MASLPSSGPPEASEPVVDASAIPSMPIRRVPAPAMAIAAQTLGETRSPATTAIHGVITVVTCNRKPAVVAGTCDKPHA